MLENKGETVVHTLIGKDNGLSVGIAHLKIENRESM